MYEPNSDEHLMMFDVPSRRSIKLTDRGDNHTRLDTGQFSPDERWVAFHATNSETRASVVYVMPTTGDLPVPKQKWIPITGPNDMGADPVWAPSGAPYLYFTSEKDGYRCVWARRFHPETHEPQDEAIAIRHFHNSRLAIRNRAGSGNLVSMSGGANQLVLTLTETTGNVWMEESKNVP